MNRLQPKIFLITFPSPPLRNRKSFMVKHHPAMILKASLNRSIEASESSSYWKMNCVQIVEAAAEERNPNRLQIQG